MQNQMRKDVFAFLIPAFTVYVVGMGVCGWDFVRRYDDGWEPSALNVLGGTMVLVGVALNVTSALTLGSFYSSTLRTREDHQLITRGAYRYIRHPIYFGTLLVTVGVSVFAGSLLGFLVMSLLVPLFLRRITLEEVMLQEEFGEQYTSYRQKTKKLVPFAY